jgi:hypothetical protein
MSAHISKLSNKLSIQEVEEKGYLLTGPDSYTFRERIKKLGGLFDRDKKGWLLTYKAFEEFEEFYEEAHEKQKNIDASLWKQACLNAHVFYPQVAKRGTPEHTRVMQEYQKLKSNPINQIV